MFQSLSALSARLTARVVAAPCNQLSISPDANAPGGQQLKTLLNQLAFYGILACGAGFLVCVAAWTLGGHAGSYGAARTGKIGVIISLACAALIGAASAILNIFFGIGSQVSASC